MLRWRQIKGFEQIAPDPGGYWRPPKSHSYSEDSRKRSAAA